MMTMKFDFALINKVITNAGLISYKELKILQANNSEGWKEFGKML